MGEAKAGKMTYSCARDPPSQTWSGSFSWMRSTENWNKWTGWARTEVVGTEGRERGQGGAVGERPGWGLRARAVDALNRWDVEQGVCRLCFTSWQISHRNFSLPAFQPQIQHVMDIWLHMSHRGFFLKVTHQKHTSQRQEILKIGIPLTAGFLQTSVFPLGHPLEGQIWTHYVPHLCFSFTLVWVTSWRKQPAAQWRISEFLLFIWFSNTKPRSRDGTINPLKHKNKTWYFHKATKKRHWIWLSYSPEFSPEVRGKASYISQHGHSIHLYDWKRMFLFALHYTHKFHPLSKSNYYWPPKYIKFGLKSVTFEDILLPTS